MKSLESFPKKVKSFDCDRYAIDVRQQIAASSPYKGDVGLELELEGHGLPTRYGGRPVNGSTWVHHADGSLRAPGGEAPGGHEYVLNQPCGRGDVERLVTDLFAYIGAQGGRIVNSTRCSTHVHLNMAGMKLNQIASFVTLWGTFEDALSSWCGAHRAGNHFALRMSDAYGTVRNWVDAFQSGNFQFSRERRYLALNPACLATFGSLEVRTMAGVDNAADVVRWVGWLMRLVDAARSDEFSDPRAIAAAFSGESPVRFSERMLGVECVDELRTACGALDEDFDALVVSGFRRVQPIAYALPWDEVLPAIKRPFVPDPFGQQKARRAARVPEGLRAGAPPRLRPEFDA